MSYCAAYRLGCFPQAKMILTALHSTGCVIASLAQQSASPSGKAICKPIWQSHLQAHLQAHESSKYTVGGVSFPPRLMHTGWDSTHNTGYYFANLAKPMNLPMITLMWRRKSLTGFELHSSFFHLSQVQ